MAGERGWLGALVRDVLTGAWVRAPVCSPRLRRLRPLTAVAAAGLAGGRLNPKDPAMVESRSSPARRRAASVQPAPAAEPALMALARQVRGWADTLINVAGGATDLGLTLAQTRIKNPKTKTAVNKAGR